MSFLERPHHSPAPHYQSFRHGAHEVWGWYHAAPERHVDYDVICVEESLPQAVPMASGKSKKRERGYWNLCDPWDRHRGTRVPARHDQGVNNEKN